MCLIGHLPDTLADRCILIRMQRKRGLEKCARLRESFAAAADLRRQCVRFAADHLSAIASAVPPLPEALDDRAGEIWEPLFVLAGLAGADWPDRARQAATASSGNTEQDPAIRTLLLDCCLILQDAPGEKIFSYELVSLLACYRDRPWMLPLKGKPPTELWLASQLRPYGIRPSMLRIAGTIRRGYAANDFLEPLRRYISPSELDPLLGEPQRPARSVSHVNPSDPTLKTADPNLDLLEDGL